MTTQRCVGLSESPPGPVCCALYVILATLRGESSAGIRPPPRHRPPARRSAARARGQRELPAAPRTAVSRLARLVRRLVQPVDLMQSSNTPFDLLNALLDLRVAFVGRNAISIARDVFRSA